MHWHIKEKQDIVCMSDRCLNMITKLLIQGKINMVEISKKELVEFEAILSDMENVINGDDELDGLELFYSDCMQRHERLRKILDNLVSKYNSLYELWEKWYNQQES